MSVLAPVQPRNTTFAFGVSPNLISTGGKLPGTGDNTGLTVIAVSTDGINYTDVDASGPTSLNGAYLSYTVYANGDATEAAIPNDQGVIDAIQANQGNATPLTDTLYYEVRDAGGNTAYDTVTYTLNDVIFSNTGGAPYGTPETVAANSATSIAGLTVDKALASGQASDGDEVLTVSVGLTPAGSDGVGGTLSLDPLREGSGAGGTVTTDTSNPDHEITITGTIDQINADLQGLTYNSAGGTADDYLTIQAVDGPATTAEFIVGEIVTDTTLTPPPGTPVTVDDQFQSNFTVRANTAGGSSTAQGFNSSNGDAIVAISADGVNFTPVTGSDDSFQTSAQVGGTYLKFLANRDGTAATFVNQDDQALIDDIHAAQPGAISDSFYYQIRHGDGTTSTDKITTTLNDVYFNTATKPFTGAETVQPGTTTHIPGLTVDVSLMTGEASDADEMVTVQLGLFDFGKAQTTHGSLAIDPDSVGLGAGGTITYHPGVAFDLVTISGTVAQVNADLAGLTYTSPVSGPAVDSIIVQGIQGATQTGNLIFGELDTACFCAGTLVRTEAGAVPVERLRIGDRVLCADGGAQPVRWIGRKAVATRFADPLRHMPVRIRAGALADGVPARDLLLSPCHAVRVGGVLAQAGALVNGTSIVREMRMPDTFTYYHVELATHDLILAEGVAAETFVDNVDRMGFDNWAEHQAMFADAAPIPEMALPRAKSHRQVPQAVRATLARRAAAGVMQAA